MKEDIDILIRGGKVYDGSGGEAFEADIGIAADRIAFVSRQRDGYHAKTGTVIDAKGLSVSPGFIDTHAHSEFTLLADSRAEGKVLQGVTTEINGNCGLSAAPLYGEAFSHREKDLKELGIRERWSTFNEYFEILEGRGLAINFATLAGHGNVRASVVGYDDRHPDRGESERMCSLLKEAVEQGAVGMSTGLIYPPGVYAETAELISLSKGIAHLIYTSHMRSEGDAVIEAIDETMRIGRESGISVHVSHIKTGGKENWHKIDDVLSAIRIARDEGLRVTADRYPYTAASTDLDAVLPSWTYAGGSEEELRRLSKREVRAQIKGEILSCHPAEDYWDRIAVSSLNRESNKWMEGERLSSLAAKKGMEPVDFLLDILIEERLRVGAIFHSMNEDNLRRFLAEPFLMIGSDSSARSTDGPTGKGKPHPRGFGTFPRFIGRYARDGKGFSIAEAIHKITMLPADTFGLRERGRIKEGFYGDLVIFDEDRIIDRATFEEPFLEPQGIDYVFVNGVPVVWQGSQTGRMPGRVLRHGR